MTLPILLTLLAITQYNICNRYNNHKLTITQVLNPILYCLISKI